MPRALLTPQEIDRYHEDGFVIPQFRLSQEEVERLPGLILRLVEENPKAADHVMNSPHVPGSGVQGLKSFPGWMEFVAHPAILDMVQQLRDTEHLQLFVVQLPGFLAG